MSVRKNKRFIKNRCWFCISDICKFQLTPRKVNKADQTMML